MNKQFIPYPKIGQYRNVIGDIKHKVQFKGLDDNGEVIYDPLETLPTLKATGFLKVHGSNFGVCWSKEAGMWTQSRKNIITPQKDNAGAAFFVESNKIDFADMFSKIVIKYGITNQIISIFGEWAGENIQKGVGVCHLPKSLFIFGLKITTLDSEGNKVGKWVDSSWLNSPNERIFNISEFPSWEIDIDFNKPQIYTEEMAEITEKIGGECPVAKHFGHSGYGEGVVWTVVHDGDYHRWKVKDDRHSNSKIKKIKVSTNPEKYEQINKMIDEIVPVSRLEQGLKEILQERQDPDIQKKHIGLLVKWIMDDVIAEEIDTLKENNAKIKDIKPIIAQKCRDFIFVKIGL